MASQLCPQSSCACLRLCLLCFRHSSSASDIPPQIFADLPGHLSSSNSTIPSHVLPTSLRPDLVLFPNQKIYILELTVPFETNILSARLRKSNRYASLLTDLRLSAYQAKFFRLELGSGGFLSPSNFETLLSPLPSKSPVTARRLRSDLSRLATLCSYAIFRS